MPRFAFLGHSDTFVSALREALEKTCPDDFVTCARLHPLDGHVEVVAPDVAAVRRALLHVQDLIAEARLQRVH